mmetsp:Transcript_10861/g.21081  ORF Transcript_10861/g.21081 Transcript_10861/m.21081 type:complete len:270 (-) Transcript_10861:3769-4578(-)
MERLGRAGDYHLVDACEVSVQQPTHQSEEATEAHHTRCFGLRAHHLALQHFSLTLRHGQTKGAEQLVEVWSGEPTLSGCRAKEVGQAFTTSARLLRVLRPSCPTQKRLAELLGLLQRETQVLDHPCNAALLCTELFTSQYPHQLKKFPESQLCAASRAHVLDGHLEGHFPCLMQVLHKLLSIFLCPELHSQLRQQWQHFNFCLTSFMCALLKDFTDLFDFFFTKASFPLLPGDAKGSSMFCQAEKRLKVYSLAWHQGGDLFRFAVKGLY